MSEEDRGREKTDGQLMVRHPGGGFDYEATARKWTSDRGKLYRNTLRAKKGGDPEEIERAKAALKAHDEKKWA